MNQAVVNGITQNTLKRYNRGELSEAQVMRYYYANIKQAKTFSLFGFTIKELIKIREETHNPILKSKISSHIEDNINMYKHSSNANELNLQKLDYFKEHALNIGLRKLIKVLDKIAYNEGDLNIYFINLLLKTEFANLSAKRVNKDIKSKIYKRKVILIEELAYYAPELNIKYGLNGNSGKNASFLTYFYLPNGVQLTWHCNEYSILNSLPQITDEWDGQVAMTMEKIINYIEETYKSLIDD